MAKFGAPEHTPFTKPYVRFIRRKGKVIPIVNRKRIGAEASRAGTSATKTGFKISAASIIAKQTKLGKAVTKDLSGITKKVKPFKIRKTDKWIIAAAKKGANISGKAVKKGFRHSGKLGVGVAVAGAAAVIFGARLEAHSEYGFDVGAQK